MRVANTALAQVGKPYKSAGSTPKGFDCSGLVWWSYKQNGISIPRITSDQAKTGSSVKKNALRVGDILVFKTRITGTGLHTGLYIGNGRFVHSPSSGRKVRVDTTKDTYWKPRLVEARRIIR